MVIKNNISALNSVRVLDNRDNVINRNIQQLSTGLRINKAADNPTNLAVSEKFRSQIGGLQAASRNANNGISLIQTAEGYLTESQNLVRRIKELAVQTANGVYQDQDRQLAQTEVNELVDEVNRLGQVANFNGLPLLDGRFSRPDSNGGSPIATSLYFQVGANSDQRVRAYIATFSSAALGIDNISLSTIDQSQRAITLVDEALNRINSQRADLGSYENRLESVVKSVDLAATNFQSAESKIRDLDIASAVVDFSRNTIVNQANIAALAQANSRAQSVLSLLQ